jgi:hypothetical protein
MFAQEIVPLAAFSTHKAAIAALIATHTTKKDTATAAACAAACGFLAAAYEADALPARDAVQVSFIKETPEHGNTSVSQGVAANLGLAPGRVGAMINGGTGPAKYQYYTNAGCLRVLGEHKPGGVSLQCVGKPLTDEERKATQALIALEIANSEAAVAKSTGATVNARPYRVFITGTVRNEWEAGGARAAELDAAAVALLGFDPTLIRPWADGSYFMSQSLEAALEFTATTCMHRNLAEAKLIDPALTVLMSVGIGRGTGQAAVQTADGRVTPINFPHGMNEPEKLVDLPERFAAALKRCDVAQVAAPIIALKSGALLLPESNAEFKQQLMALLSS